MSIWLIASGLVVLDVFQEVSDVIPTGSSSGRFTARTRTSRMVSSPFYNVVPPSFEWISR